jgi:hypothetical protein
VNSPEVFTDRVDPEADEDDESSEEERKSAEKLRRKPKEPAVSEITKEEQEKRSRELID